MSAAAAIVDEAAPAKKGRRKKLLIMVLPVVLLAGGAGLWFSGVVPNVLGAKHEAEAKDAGRTAPVFVELPEMVANLNAGGRRTSFIKLKARLELAKISDIAAFTDAQPRIIDLFQTYLREVRPEELRGSAGTYRLREELIARAGIAAAPAKVVDVLFTEMLVQ